MNDHFHHCLGEESARHWWVLGEVASNEEGDSAERDIVVHSLAKSTVKSGEDHRRNVGKLINDDKQQVFHVQFITEFFELRVSERVDWHVSFAPFAFLAGGARNVRYFAHRFATKLFCAC